MSRDTHYGMHTSAQKTEALSLIEPVYPLTSFCLDPNVLHLSHGSFGGTPRSVHAARLKELEWLEANPDGYFMKDARSKLREAGAQVALRFHANPLNLVLQTNATLAMQTALVQQEWQPGQTIICTSQNYVTVAECIRALKVKEKLNVSNIFIPPCDIDTASTSHPVPDTAADSVTDSDDKITRAIIHEVSMHAGHKCVLVIDHVSSSGARIFPLEKILSGVREVRRNSENPENIIVIIDGAHAPGMLDLNLEELGQQGVDFYAGNLHKWACCPHGTGFLWVHPERQLNLHPLIRTFNAPSLWDRFEWQGTSDLSPFLALPQALRFFDEMSSINLSKRNHDLAATVQELWCKQTGTIPVLKDSHFGSMVLLHVPCKIEIPLSAQILHALRHEAFETHRVELPFVTLAHSVPSGRKSKDDSLQDSLHHVEERLYVRPSCHGYNSLGDYLNLGTVVKRTIEKVAPQLQIHY